MRGLRQVEPKLKELNIPFYMMYGKAEDNVPKLVEDLGAGLLICDFVPVRAAREWREKVGPLAAFLIRISHSPLSCVYSLSARYQLYFLNHKCPYSHLLIDQNIGQHSW